MKDPGVYRQSIKGYWSIIEYVWKNTEVCRGVSMEGYWSI